MKTDTMQALVGQMRELLQEVAQRESCIEGVATIQEEELEEAQAWLGELESELDSASRDHNGALASAKADNRRLVKLLSQATEDLGQMLDNMDTAELEDPVGTDICDLYQHLSRRLKTIKRRPGVEQKA